MTRKLRVGFDLDGVCVWFAETVWEYLVSIGKVTGPCPKVNNWYFYREPVWGSMTDKVFVQTCHDGVDAGIIFNGDPLPGARETMNYLYGQGHKIIVVTDRSFGINDGFASRQRTYTWLRQHGFKFHEVVFTADKTTVQIDTMVDDKLENYDALKKAGVDVYLLNRPWNHDGADHRVRINHIRDYVIKVQDIANKKSFQKTSKGW